ncbi:40693_t:CDS:2, partial [Gigaspora margarita]
KPDHLAHDCLVKGIGIENEKIKTTKDTKRVVEGIVEINQKSSGISNTKKTNEDRTYNCNKVIVVIEVLLDIITKMNT